MPNPSISNENACGHASPRRTCNPAIPNPALYQAGYQQALTDFAISDLLHRLNTYSDAHFAAAWFPLTTPETETLAAILIQTLTSNLTGNLLATYLAPSATIPSMCLQCPLNCNRNGLLVNRSFVSNVRESVRVNLLTIKPFT